MSNPDNIAAMLAAGGEKAAGQEDKELSTANAAAQNASIDKVSAVDPTDTRQENAGLTGAARDVAPVVPQTREREQKFGPIVSSAIATINDYEVKMADNVRVTPEYIDAQQSRLYNAIRAIVTVEESSEFMGGMEFLFRKFHEDKYGAFNGTTVRRRINFMKKPSGEQAFKAYTAFIDLLQVFSDPKGRKVQWARFNKRQALDFLQGQPELRQRLETYMSKICS